VDLPVANFFASGLLALEEKLGPILWQFSAQLAYSEERFESFLRLLPRTTGEAATLAARHDERLEGRSWTECSLRAPLRHAFEVRHPSFFTPSFIDLLRRHDAALVLADTAGRWPYAEEITADFVYIRLHGAEALYTSRYSDEQLDWWAARIAGWRAERDVYVYFDNDAKVHAPFDAMRLAERVA
jgi:uncharacterized protein YecE (DUF72 family)